MTTPGAVTVIAPIEPRNDAAFHIVEDVDVKGGAHAVADVTARDAIPAYLLKPGTLAVLPDGTQYAWSGSAWVTAGGGGAVDSVNGQTGVVVLDAGDVGADPAGTAAGAVAAHVAASDPHGDRAYAAGLVVPVERGVGDEWVWRPMMSASVDPLPLVRGGSGSASIAVVDPGAALGFGAVRISSGTGSGSIYSFMQLGAQSRIRTGLLMRSRFTPQLGTAQAQRTSGFFDVNARNGAGFFFAGLNVVARAGVHDGTQTSTTYTLSVGTAYTLETEVLSPTSAKFAVYDGLTGELLWTETVTGITFPAVGVRVWAWGSSHISAPGVATVIDDLHDFGFGTRIGYDVHRKGPQ